MFHVAYCIDKNYQQHFGASITSLLLNFSGDATNLSIHVVTDHADPDFRAKLDLLNSLFKARIELHFVRPEDIQSMASFKAKSAPHVTTAAYFRLLLSSILPETVKKVLYLDADTIVLSDLAEMLRIDLAGAAVAGVPDYSAKDMTERHQIKQYINTGVMLLDLDQWRQKDYGVRCMTFASQNQEKLYFGDQCTINLLFQDSLNLLHSKWNFYVTPFQQSKPSENIAILHFITGDKPWHSWYENEVAKLYWRYLDVSPWTGAVPVAPTTLDKAHRLARLLHRQNKSADAISVYEQMLASLNRLSSTTPQA